MWRDFLKNRAMSLIGRGFQLPESIINRVQELVMLRKLLDQLQINCVLDVGANCGQFAHELRRIGYRGHMISFEPVEREFAQLSESFRGDSKWRGYRLALGSENKHARIHVPASTVMSSLLSPLEHDPAMQLEEIEVRRLDDLLPSLLADVHQPRVFLKMDTQGYDLEVFKGARGCIGEILGLQSEISVQPLYQEMPHYLEALAVYESAGFELYNLSVVLRNRSRALQELNCFMRRPLSKATD